MRGEERRQRTMLMVIDPEQRVPKRASAAADQTTGGCGAERVVADL
jgi:hypothetical protein